MRRRLPEVPHSAAITWGLRLVLFALAVVAVALALARWDGVDRCALLVVLGIALAIAGVAMLVALFGFVAIWREGLKGAGRGVFVMVLAAGLAAAPAWVAFRGLGLPRLNDVSTDPEQRIEFSRGRAALAARANRVPPDPPPGAAAQQRQAYAGLAPVILERPVEEAYDIAREAARQLGWRLVEETPPGGRSGSGRFDAVVLSRWLRFADDVVVRVRPQAGGARIDMRSASRIGRHDFGANAARILAFSELVREIDETR